MLVYLNNRFIELEKATLSPFDRGFLFADGVYEAIRTYNKKLFRFEEHLKRLKRSLAATKINFDDFNPLEQIIYTLIQKNKIENEALVYLQITRGIAYPRSHGFPKEKTNSTIFISAKELIDNKKEELKGIKVTLQEDLRWLRCDIKSISLLPAVLANQKAMEAGAGEAIFVRDELITEGTHTNFFAVKNNTIYTAPVSNYILAGITRAVAIELAIKLKINIVEEFINKNDLTNYSEFFITSTTKEITPVVKICDKLIGDGNPGVVTKKLQSAFTEYIKR